MRRAASWVLAHPWITLAVLMAVAFALRYVAALQSPTPWIFADEFIYWELGKSIAEGRGFYIRDTPVLYSILVPVLEAPGFLSGSPEVAYAWIKGMNTAAMCLAAVPAYAIARRALSVAVSLAFAAVVLLLPAFAYTATVMTEPVFLLACMGFLWALVEALRSPSWQRQGLLMLITLLAISVRLQAVIFLVCVVIAVIIGAALGAGGDRSAARRFAAFWPSLLFAFGLPLLAVIAQILRGAPLRGILGGYAQIGTDKLDLGAVWDWGLEHIAVLSLGVGIVPAVIGVAAWITGLRPGSARSNPGIILVATLAVAGPMLLQVSAFASGYALKVEERNLAIIAPILVLAALVGALRSGVSRPAIAISAVGIFACIFTMSLHFLLSPPPYADTFTLVALWRAAMRFGWDPQTVLLIASIIALIVVVALLVLRRPRTTAVAVVVIAAVTLLMGSVIITPAIARYSRDVAAGTVPTPKSWIDDAVGPDADVTMLWPSDSEPKYAWETEIWNNSVRNVVAVPGEMPALTDERGEFDGATGRLRALPGFSIPDGGYFVAPRRWQLDGEPIAQASTPGEEFTLWRTAAPASLMMGSEGISPDGWIGKRSKLIRYGCVKGVFTLGLDPAPAPARSLLINASGYAPRRVSLSTNPTRRVRLVTRVKATNGACTVSIVASNTRTGNELAGNGDPRSLGARITSWRFASG